MGLFDFFTKTRSIAKQWDDFDSATRADKLARPMLERAATTLGMTEARATKKGNDVELTGVLDGFPCRVAVSWGGSLEISVRYDEALTRLCLDHDPKAKPDAQSWEKERRIAVGPNIFIPDDIRVKGAFEAMAPELRKRIVEGIDTHRLSWLRSDTGDTEVTVHGGIVALEDPEKSVVELVRLVVDVAKGRGATPSPMPGAPVDPKRPFAGWKHLGQEEKWSRALAFGESLTARVKGRLEQNREERQMEVRWTENGVPLRIALDLDFLNVKPGALVKNMKRELDLYWEPERVVREELSGDAWSDADVVFLAPSIVLKGDESDIREQMALVRAVPEPLLEELFEAMVRHRLAWVNIEDEILDVDMPDWPKTDDGTAAIEVARLFGRIAATLPREAPAVVDRVVRCKFCHGLWFPSDKRATCTQCGAPA